MDFTTELKSVLEDTDEPLNKRLKIAQNAFNSIELMNINKENVLLEWFSKIAHQSNTKEVWNILYDCLSSEHMQNLRQNEIKKKTLFRLVKTITKSLKQDLSDDVKKIVIDCALIIVENNGLKKYFKHEMQQYCTFVSVLFANIDDLSQLVNIIDSPFVFNPKMFVKEENCEYLLEIVGTLADAVLKFKDDSILQVSSKLLYRTLFQVQLKMFETYFVEVIESNSVTAEFLLNIFTTNLEEFYKYDTEKAQICYKIILKSFLENNRKQNSNNFGFIVIILQVLGFENIGFDKVEVKNVKNYYDINKSLLILSDIFEIIKTLKPITAAINDISFGDYVKNILKYILKEKPPLNSSILKIFEITIELNPLIIDKLITEIITYTTLLKKDEHLQDSYVKFMLSMFDMYYKLHRVHKFISEYLRTIKTALENENDIILLEEILPKLLLYRYEFCVKMITGKQNISILRTCVSNLEDIVENLQDCANDPRKMLYLQIVTEFLYNFLGSVRFSEYGTPQLTIDKFTKDIIVLKDILKKFGTSLLSMEHNQSLMLCFLRICKMWGANILFLKYYLTPSNGTALKDISSFEDIGDYSLCPDTYLHGYLTSEQWSIMLQRVKNFGDLSCKTTMYVLIFQRIKGYTVLNQHVKENLPIIVQTTLQELDDDYIHITKENCTGLLLFYQEQQHFQKIAEYILDDYILNGNLELIQDKKVVDSKKLLTTILYQWFVKIKKIFKMKRKINENISKPLTTEILNCVTAEKFFNEDQLEESLDNISKCFDAEITTSPLKIDEKMLIKLLGTIKYIPVYNFEKNIQNFYFLFLLGLRVDLQKYRISDEICATCEKLLQSFLQTPFTSTSNVCIILQEHALLKTVVTRLTDFKDILTLLVHKAFKSDETISKLKISNNNIEIEDSDDKLNIQIHTIYINALNQATKQKLTEENKEYIKNYRHSLCEKLFMKVHKAEEITTLILESYVLILQYFLLQENKDNFEKLMDVKDNYINYVEKNIESIDNVSILIYLEILLRNKSKFNLSEDFVLKCWLLVENIKNVNENEVKYLNRTVSLIFEYVSNVEFKTVLDKLLMNTIQPLENNDIPSFINYLNIWQCLVHSALSTVKQETLLVTLQQLWEDITVYLSNNTNEDFDTSVVKFQKDIIENKKITPTVNIVDLFLQTVSILVTCKHNFFTTFNLCFSIMHSLLQHRKYIIIDRLPSFLVNLRMLVNKLCTDSSEDKKELYSSDEKEKISECAFEYEKLVRASCYLKKDMSRLAPYLISDIIKHYEKTTFLPGVKNHLDNCLYFLIEVCDRHAISYLFRVLSAPSTELFKNIYDNYNKYHKFTGKI